MFSQKELEQIGQEGVLIPGSVQKTCGSTKNVAVAPGDRVSGDHGGAGLRMMLKIPSRAQPFHNSESQEFPLVHPGVFPALYPSASQGSCPCHASKGWAGGMQSLPASPSLGNELIAPPRGDTTRSALDV